MANSYRLGRNFEFKKNKWYLGSILIYSY
jgi:hypothetical protein